MIQQVPDWTGLQMVAQAAQSIRALGMPDRRLVQQEGLAGEETDLVRAHVTTGIPRDLSKITTHREDSKTDG